MSLLLLFQPLSITPVAPSGVYTLPLSGLVQAVYPNGPETTPSIAGTLDEGSRMSGIVGQI